jgi:hypothetical protein
MFWRTIPKQQGRLILLAVLTSVLIPTRGAAQAPLVPVLSFISQTSQVQGVTPGGTVVWFAAIRDVDEYTVAQTSVAQVAVADQTGMSTLTLTSPISPNSIWVAVDLKTGADVIGSPSAAFPLQLTTLEPDSLSVGAGASPDYLLDNATRIQVLLVRPGKGAWTKTVGRGGVDDEAAPTDAKLRFRLGHMEALIADGDLAPDKATAKDLLFVVHVRTMDVATLIVGARP